MHFFSSTLPLYWFKYRRHVYSMPCRLPLHHRLISMPPLRPRIIQPCRRPSCMPALPHRRVLRPRSRQRHAHQLQCRHIQQSDAGKQRIILPALPSRRVLRPRQRQLHAHQLQHGNLQSADEGRQRQRLSTLPTWHLQLCNRSITVLSMRGRNVQHR